ncbi:MULTISPECIES: hypothetical protein [Candidatus Nitrosocaldus]|jgi:transcription initiation factor TFIIIB Brf1 subunit/transcription initiation factor TFIIB|nr:MULTISPECIES: hypothetical protein [Candidatus Nitrosocaldus]
MQSALLPYYNMMKMTETESSDHESVKDRVGVDSCKHRLIYDPEAGEWICSKCGRVFSLEEAIEVEVERRREEVESGVVGEERARTRAGAGTEGADTDRARAESATRVEAEARAGTGAEVITVTATRLQDVGLDPRGETNFWLTGLGTLESRKEEEEILKSHLANIFSKLSIPFHIAQEIEREVKSILKHHNKNDRVTAYTVYTVVMKDIYRYGLYRRLKLQLQAQTQTQTQLQAQAQVQVQVQTQTQTQTQQPLEEYVATVIAMRFNKQIEPVYSLPFVKANPIHAHKCMKKFYNKVRV